MRAIAIFGLLACLSTSALPQSPTVPSPHGGQVRMAGPYRLELLSRRGEIVIHVTDRAGSPVDTAGGKGKAVVHTDGRSVTIPLQAAGPSSLSGHGRYHLKHSSVIYVTVNLKHARAHHAVFRPLADAIEPAGDSRH